MFIKENVNPKNRIVCDCVIRAIAKAESKEWLEVFDSLTSIARQKFSVLNDSKIYSIYLSIYDNVNCMYYENDNKYRLTIKQLCDQYNKGTFVVQVSNHLTTVIDGDLYDTWNCLDKKIYKIWRVK